MTLLVMTATNMATPRGTRTQSATLACQDSQCCDAMRCITCRYLRSDVEALSDEQVAELKVGFLLYAQDGKILAKDLGTVMRSLGLIPTNAELAEMAGESERSLEFPEFLNLAAQQKAKEPTLEEQLKLAFENLDQNKAGVEELKAILTGAGEALKPEEFDEFIKLVKPKNTLLKLDEFIRILTSK